MAAISRERMDDVLRAYEALWAETDPHRRAGLIADCLADTAEIIGPQYCLRGYQAIGDEAARFQRDRPGAKAMIASGIDTHSGWARFAVKVVGPDGAVVAQGLDVVEFGADGRIARVITFWGALPAQPASLAARTLAIGELAWEVHDDVPAELARAVDDGLDAANRHAAPMHEVRRLGCFARGADGVVIGGAVGRTWGECCELQQLWVDAANRHAGTGSRLVRLFEQRAIERGCRTSYLDTFTFQAPGFYRKLGYVPALEIAGYTPATVRYTMLRRLDAPA